MLHVTHNNCRSSMIEPVITTYDGMLYNVTEKIRKICVNCLIIKVSDNHWVINLNVTIACMYAEEF